MAMGVGLVEASNISTVRCVTTVLWWRRCELIAALGLWRSRVCGSGRGGHDILDPLLVRRLGWSRPSGQCRGPMTECPSRVGSGGDLDGKAVRRQQAVLARDSWVNVLDLVPSRPDLGGTSHVVCAAFRGSRHC
jgi:hypothetical protein